MHTTFFFLKELHPRILHHDGPLAMIETRSRVETRSSADARVYYGAEVAEDAASGWNPHMMLILHVQSKARSAMLVTDAHAGNYLALLEIHPYRR